VLADPQGHRRAVIAASQLLLLVQLVLELRLQLVGVEEKSAPVAVAGIAERGDLAPSRPARETEAVASRGPLRVQPERSVGGRAVILGHGLLDLLLDLLFRLLDLRRRRGRHRRPDKRDLLNLVALGRRLAHQRARAVREKAEHDRRGEHGERRPQALARAACNPVLEVGLRLRLHAHFTIFWVTRPIWVISSLPTRSRTSITFS